VNVTRPGRALVVDDRDASGLGGRKQCREVAGHHLDFNRRATIGRDHGCTGAIAGAALVYGLARLKDLILKPRVETAAQLGLSSVTAGGYSRSMQPLPLNQRLDRIGQHIVRARLFLDLWFYFEERVSRRKIIETMQEYSEFFIFTPHAYLVAYVIYMAGVFDKRRDTISLRPLVREVKKAGQLQGQGAAAG
jgi:hypothetical protein